MSKGIKGIIVEIGGDTSALEKALSKVNSKSGSLSKELKGINSLLKLDPSNVELLNQKQTILNESIETTQDKLTQLKKIKEEADKKMADGTKISEENYRNLQREIINTENKLNSLTEELKQFNVANSNITKAGKKVEEYGKKIENAGKKVDELGNKLSIISGAAVAGGTVLANSAMGLEDAVAKYVATTNIAEGETEKYKQVLENINNNNYGEGYEDIADAMSNVTMQLKDLNNTDLQNITEKAIAFRDMFGYEVSESIRAVKALMDNFKISADEAFNLLTEGKKQGLDFSNELLDNVNEYSVQFNKLGLTAEDMFNIFKTGSENGAFNLDKIGDAVKEFSIRAIDGSNTTIDGFKRIGLNADTMAKKFANGGEEAKQAFIEVVNRLGSMDDKVSQSIAGVDLFGTMWEDLGPTVITSFSKMDNGISQSSDSMQKSIDELYNTTKKKAETQLKRLQSLGADFGEEMLPVLEDLIDLAEGFIKKLEGMSDEEKENIVKIGLLVAGMGPLTKILGTATKGVGKVSEGIGIFTQAIEVARGKTTSSVTSVNNLAKAFSTITSPVGLATSIISVAMIGIVSAIKNAEAKTTEAFSDMATGASDFITGISNAESYLESFDATLFASSEEQKKLQDNMSEVQDGITKICKTASDERRNYTQEEIKKLDEYFTKLRELNQKELEIQQEISGAISQQAISNAETFKGSAEEYKVVAQNWINTATQQKEKIINLANQQSVEELALLNQRYATEASRQTEEYQNEYNRIIAQKEEKIAQANDEVAQISKVYADGYTERLNISDLFNQKVQTNLALSNLSIEDENQRHTDRLKEIQDGWYLTETDRQKAIEQENESHKNRTAEIWRAIVENMSESEREQLGSWIAMQAQTELYGGKIDDEAQKMINSITESFNEMPKKTQNTMKDALEPMMTEMENKEPSLFAKASGIASGIISRLNKAFNFNGSSKNSTLNLPGHKTGLDYVPYDNYIARLHKGERVLTAKENKQLMSLDKMRRFSQTGLGGLTKQISKNTTNYVTLQPQFYPQSMTEAEMKKCSDYMQKELAKYL